LQFTFAGASSVYYGSEVGLAGPEGHNRRCMPWEASQQDQDLRTIVKHLIDLRKKYPVFSEVDLKWLLVDAAHQSFIFKKENESSKIVVIVNTSQTPVVLDLPDSLKFQEFMDGWTGDQVKLGSEIELDKLGYKIFLKTYR
jgi:glycosidase